MSLRLAERKGSRNPVTLHTSQGRNSEVTGLRPNGQGTPVLDQRQFLVATLPQAEKRQHHLWFHGAVSVASRAGIPQKPRHVWRNESQKWQIHLCVPQTSCNHLDRCIPCPVGAPRGSQKGGDTNEEYIGHVSPVVSQRVSYSDRITEKGAKTVFPPGSDVSPPLARNFLSVYPVSAMY